MTSDLLECGSDSGFFSLLNVARCCSEGLSASVGDLLQSKMIN